MRGGEFEVGGGQEEERDGCGIRWERGGVVKSPFLEYVNFGGCV